MLGHGYSKEYMTKEIQHLVISTPGRICLFGEHQDYLQLPVVPCAISLRLTIEGKRLAESHVNIDLPDIGLKESFPLRGPQSYITERDYYRSVFNVLFRYGYTFSGGFDCSVRSTIPINAGTASSSALVVSWVNFLAQMSDQGRQLFPKEVASYAYEAEVLEFREPGGMMDQCSTAYGGVISIDFLPELKVEPMNAEIKSFVVGDSGEPKDTKSILARIKHQVLNVLKQLSTKHPRFSLLNATVESVNEIRKEVTSDQCKLLLGTLRNRDITSEARKLLKQTPLDHRRLGNSLTEHQAVLRDVLKISTPKIDRMIDAAMSAGAYGGKINGSGGGGCMFVYAPEHPERVAEAIERVGGKAYIVTVDTWSRNEQVGILD